MKVVACIISQNSLAKNLIKKSFEELVEIIQEDKIDRIILISPNHLNQGHEGVIISDQDFFYESGQVITDKEAVKAINKHAEIFKRESGVDKLVPFIGKYFPGIPLVAMIVKNNLTKEKADEIIDSLDKDLTGNSLVVLSTDFSHCLDKNLVNLHNEKAVAVISNLNYERVFNLEMDCAPGLYMIMKLSEKKGFNYFEPFENSNSSIMLKDGYAESTVNHVAGFFQKGEKKEKEMPIDLLFGDDFGKNTGRILMSQDLNIDRNFFSENRIQQRTIEGKKITLIVYDPAFDEEADEIFRLIEENKPESDFLIIYVKWGPELERELAHNFIEDGVDMIVGSYSQDILPVEIYKEKPIFYSLGDKLALLVSIKKEKKDFCLTPIEFQENYKIALANKETREEILLKLASISEVEENIKDDIRFGLFSMK